MKVEVDPVTHDVYITCLEGSCSAGNPEGNVNFTDGQHTVLFHQNEDGSWTVPEVGPMTDDEFEEWLDENPEAAKVLNDAKATLTALASVPTATSEPTATAEPTATVQSVLPAGGSSSACKTIQPEGGSSLPHQGKVKFEWEAQSGAEKYVITFVNTNGNTVSFDTKETSIEKYIEILPEGGDYSWNVTAIGADGSEICKSPTVSFSKPDSKWTPPEKPQEEEEEPMCDPMDCQGSCPDSYYCGG
jgi:hypothetical protein